MACRRQSDLSSACYKWCIRLIVLCGLSLPTLSGKLYGADIHLVPVSATVPHTIVGSDITVHAAGATITLDIMIGGWGPTDNLRTAQIGIESSGYATGSGGSLAPLTTPNPGAGAFINTARPDYVLFGISAFAVVDLSSLDYRFASSSQTGEGAIDTGDLRYMGTLKLVATPDDFGTYTIEFIPSSAFLENEVLFPITPVFLHPARINIFPRIYVNDDATGTNNGASWANAFSSLQDALAAATAGTEVWVAAGNYRPDLGNGITPGDRNATFQLLNNVALYGGFAGTETTLNQRDPAVNMTALRGDLLNNDVPVACTQNSPDCDSFGKLCIDNACILSNNNFENSYRVVNGSGTDSTAVMDGFQVLGGKAHGGPGNDRGAGMYNSAGSPTVRNCTFRGNDAGANGGGIFTLSGSPTISNCTFSGNNAFGRGGGISNDDSNPMVTHCTFLNNNADFDGGGMFNDNASSPKVTNCVFSANNARFGGGMLNIQSSNPAVTNCTFGGNAAGIGGGGGMWNDSNCNPSLANCTFSGNSTASSGGGMLNRGINNPTVTNCTFSGNSAVNDGGGMYNFLDSSPTVNNCVLWGNSDSGGMDESAQIHTASGTPTVHYSVVQGGWSGAGGTGVVNSDPQFVDADGADNTPGTIDDNLALLSTSPAIDAGSRAAVPADGADLDNDGNTSELTPLDLDGSPRFRNEPTVFDTGTGGIPVPDMGAYEFQPAFVDCNNNGIPDDLDIFFGTSIDLNMDGIPDECAAFDNGCLPVPDWSCPDNWDLGGAYPDNGVNNYSVVIGGDVSVCLDVGVKVDTVLLQDGASLDMSGSGDCDGSLDLAAPGGIVVTDDATLTIGPGQSIGEPEPPSGAGMTISEGAVVQVSDSTITLSGDVVVASGGTYVPLPPEETNMASLNAGNLTITNDPVTEAPPGEVLLTGGMTLTVTEDLTLDGSYAEEPCPPPARFARSFHTPPSLIIRHQAAVVVGDSVGLISSVELLHDSTLPITVGGDFMNHSITSECVDLTEGAGVELDGPGATQRFEAAATDLGATGNIFLADYALPALTVAAGSQVEFIDEFDNDELGQGPCTEAVYVENLILGAQAMVTIRDCRVYYQTASLDSTAIVSTVGCGELKSVDCVTAAAADPETTPVAKTRFISFHPGNAGTQTAIRVMFVSLHHPIPPYTGGPTIPFTAFEGQSRWVGPPQVYLESSSSGKPFLAAALQCAPHFQDWGADLLHVTGAGVVPSSLYHVQMVAQACNTSSEQYYSAPLEIATTRWGDVRTPYNPPDPSVQPDISDVSALIDKFRSTPGSPIKAKALLAGAPANPFGEITPAVLEVDFGFGHVSACVDAFRGIPYPFVVAGCP